MGDLLQTATLSGSFPGLAQQVNGTALAYLDIIREIRDAVTLPVSAYQVSGEYAMIKAAAERGWLNEEKAILETLTSIKRAGADMIASYFAKDAVKLIG